MDNPSLSDRENRALNRAIRITPSGLREQYSQKWQSALNELPEGHQRQQYRQTIRRTAFRLRLADFGRYLLGGYGLIPGVVAWLIPLIFFTTIPVFSLLFAPAILAVMAGALFYAGLPTRLHRSLMAGSIIVGLSAFAYFLVGHRRHDRRQRRHDSHAEIRNIRRNVTTCHAGKRHHIHRRCPIFVPTQHSPRKLNRQDFRPFATKAFRRPHLTM